MKEATYRCASALAATSYYVDKAAAEQAVALALPMLETAMRNAEVGESGFLDIVVMDPAITPPPPDSKTPCCTSMPSATRRNGMPITPASRRRRRG